MSLLSPPTEPATETDDHSPAVRWGVDEGGWRPGLSEEMVALLAPPVVVSAVRPATTRRAGRAVPAVTVST